jgi:hypothetical protein
MLTTPVSIVRSSLIHEGHLYYSEDRLGVKRVPLGGGTPELIVADATRDPRLLAFDGGFLYYKQSYEEPYARLPEADFAATPEPQGGTSLGFASVVSGGYLYGHDTQAGEPPGVWRQDFVSGEVTVLATVGEEVGGLDVADGQVYFTDNSFGVEDLFRVAITGGEVQRLSNGSHFRVRSVRVLDGKVYWADGYGMYVTDPTATDPSTRTVRFGSYGPNPSAIGNGTRGGGAFTLHGGRVYWVDDAGTVGWTSLDRTSCGAIFSQGGGSRNTVLIGPDHAYVLDVGIIGKGIWRTAL